MEGLNPSINFKKPLTFPALMEEKEKKILKLKLGLAIVKILAENLAIAKANKEKGTRDHRLVSSLRKLAAASGIDYGTIQKISKGLISPEFVNVIVIIESLDKNLSQFSKYYDSISDRDILDFQLLNTKSKARTEIKKSKKK